MSLLTICQDVAEEVGIDAPSYIVGNPDKTAKQLYRLANREGAVLAKRGAWVQLITSGSITTVIDQETYSKPADFDYMIDDTVWHVEQYRKVRGAASSQEWQEIKRGLVNSSIVNMRYRFSGNYIYLDPVPTSSFTVSYEYISSSWARTSGGSAASSFSADTDTHAISDYLVELGVKWRFLQAKGLDYQESYNEYVEERERAFARNIGLSVINKGMPKTQFSNIPQTGFGE